MAKIEMPTEEELADAVRQYEWRTASVERMQADRADRLRKLQDREEPIRRALQAYRALPRRFSPVRLRREFVALQKPRPLPPALGGLEPEEPVSRSIQLEDDYRTRPPSTKLLMHKTHALPSYLAMLYVTQTEPNGAALIRGNASRTNGVESWSVLCGRWFPTVRGRRARMTRDLDELHRADLVTIGAVGAQGRYEHFALLADDLTDQPYTLPGRRTQSSSVITLPHTFFTNGWHLALTPAEIAALLMTRDATRTLPPTPDAAGVAVPRSVRWATYGISGEAYHAIHELEEFGLLIIHDTMPHRRHGKLRQLTTEVKATVEADGESTSPVPYRLQCSSDDAIRALGTGGCRQQPTKPLCPAPVGFAMSGDVSLRLAISLARVACVQGAWLTVQPQTTRQGPVKGRSPVLGAGRRAGDPPGAGDQLPRDVVAAKLSARDAPGVEAKLLTKHRADNPSYTATGAPFLGLESLAHTALPGHTPQRDQP